MKRDVGQKINRWTFLLGILFLALIGCSDKSGSIWFDDLESNCILTNSEIESIRLYINNKVKNGEQSQIILADNLIEDGNPKIVFISLSDGKSSAKIFEGKGFGILNAINNGVNKINNQLNKEFEKKWIKVDIVSKIIKSETIKTSDRLSWDRSIFGIAFSRESNLVFLPEVIMANSIINSKQNLNPDNLINEIQETQSAKEKASEIFKADEITITRFLTYSIFIDDGSVVPLYRGHRMFDNLSADLVLESAVAGGNYLASTISHDGKFVYSYLPKSSKEKNDYNIVRHAGTVFSMLQLYNVTKNQNLIIKSGLALEYLSNTIKRISTEKGNFNCVVSGKYTNLGANALSVIAMVYYYNQTNDKKYLQAAQKLSEWILAAQSRNGEFIIQKQSYPDGRVIPFQSEYYPGEALLALVTLYKTDRNEKWINVAETGAEYLINIRDGNKTDEELAHDHWLLYALNELYRIKPNKIYLNHVMRLARVILNNQRIENVECRDWLGSFYTPPRSTPTATRMEGLYAAYQLARDYNNNEMKNKIREGLERGVQFQLQTQFRDESAMYLDDPQRVLGGFKKSLTNYELRIDYTQHNICGLLGMYSVLKENTD